MRSSRNPRLSESVRRGGDAAAKGADVEGQTKPPPAPKANARAGKYGKERDQATMAAKVYLRCAKWGARTLYPFVMHIAVLLLVARYTRWYDITWTTDGKDASVSVKAAWTLLMAYTFTIVLSLKPVVGLFKWLLEPNIRRVQPGAAKVVRGKAGGVNCSLSSRRHRLE